MKPKSRKQLERDIEDWRDLVRNRIERVDELKAELAAKDSEIAALRAEIAELRASPRRLARTTPARIAPMRKAG